MQELGRLGSRVEQRLRRVFPERRFLLHPAEAAEGLLGVDVTRDNDLLFILVADYVTDAWQVEEHLTHLCDALLAAHGHSHHQTLWTEITQYELSVISFRYRVRNLEPILPITSFSRTIRLLRRYS